MYCASHLTATKLSEPLATRPPVSLRPSKRTIEHVVEGKGTHAEHHFAIQLAQTPARQEAVTKRWKEVKATVLRDHEIPDRVAKRTQIRVPDAPMGRDTCLDRNSYIQRLAVKLLFPMFERDMSPTPY